MEWGEEGDSLSFEDSERFDEDSLCSWMSERESVCNHWRGWKKPAPPSQTTLSTKYNYNATGRHESSQGAAVTSLVELAAREVAAHIPFEVVEHVYPPVPEQLQLRIAFWSFPESEEDIRLYSCLATGSADEFTKGEHLFKTKATRVLLQIGFHLSATVKPSGMGSGGGQGASKNQQAAAAVNPAAKSSQFNVAVTFDRRRITSCNCTCVSTASWCSHVVAVCLHRIHQPTTVCLRAPVSESLSRLHRDQLQKFAQYLISELPQQILPTAQRLLDELLSSHETDINTLRGAPDPTAGASMYEQTSWCLDEGTLHESIRKILLKLSMPSPIVFSDVNFLSSTSPPAASEWQSLLRPLRGREPEGIWNLLSIVREMFRRADRNAVPLLELLTEEMLAREPILMWWFNTKVSLHTGSTGGQGHRSSNNNGVSHSTSQSSQHTCASLCDEIVVLWRLAALNPALSPLEKTTFFDQMCQWHCRVLECVFRSKSSQGGQNGGNPGNGNNNGGTSNINLNKRWADIDVFPGFKPALESCLLDWLDYPIPGITYNEGGACRFYSPYMHLRLADHSQSGGKGRPVEIGRKSPYNVPTVSGPFDTGASSTRSSLSSEGFNENLGNNNNSNDTSCQHLQPPQVSGASASNNNNNNGGADAEPRDEVGPSNRDAAGPSRAANAAPAGAAAPAAADAAPNAAAPNAAAPPDDEYQMYYYDAAQARAAAQQNYGMPVAQKPNPIPEPSELSKQIKKMEDRLEILFARAEALHAHGHTQEACKLAFRLAQELLASPPSFEMEQSSAAVSSAPAGGKTGNGGKRGRGKFNPACHQASLLAMATLSKAAFLCQVLGENHTDHHYLAFRIGIFGLELVRPPASTKPLEVRLVNHEQDLVTLLKKIPLGHLEMHELRERATALRERRLVARGEALLPLMLASYIFDALVLSKEQPGSSGKGSSSYSGVVCRHRLPGDEELGFEAAVAALGLKANVSEAEHPLLCEGTRRQRGELAITLLMHYKDDQHKLAMIMDKLLDKEVHQMYKNPPSTLTASLYGASAGSSSKEAATTTQTTSTASATAEEHAAASWRRAEDEGANSPPSGWEEDYKAWEAKFRCTNFKAMFRRHHSSNGMASIDSSAPETTSSDNSPTLIRRRVAARTAAMESSDSGSSGESSDSFASSSSGDRNKGNQAFHPAGAASSGAGPQPTAGLSGLTGAGALANSAHVANASQQPRDMNLSAAAGAVAAPTVGPNMFAVDEFNAAMVAGPSSMFTMDEFNPNIQIVQSQQQQQQQQQQQPQQQQQQQNRNQTLVTQMKNITVSNGQGGQNGARGGFKGGSKRSFHPSIPNQPSEASAHFMFELAKTVFTKAGGNNSMAVNFTQPSSSQNHRGPHRALHMCSFQIGLYALGLTNAVSPNWLSRTYSSQVSWITGQAMEIGGMAILFLIDTWEGHLTPTEVVTLADKASRGRDPGMQRACAELALSCLPHAHALNQNEIQRALLQCKEQSADMLKRACLTVETAAQGGGVIPEVLFDVARRWYDLYEEGLGDRPASPPPPQRQQHPQQQPQHQQHPLPPPQHPATHNQHGPTMEQAAHMFVDQPAMQMPPSLPAYPHTTYMPPPQHCSPYSPYSMPPPFVVPGAIHPAYLPQYHPTYPPPPQQFYPGAPTGPQYHPQGQQGGHPSRPHVLPPHPPHAPPHHAPPPPLLAPLVATPPPSAQAPPPQQPPQNPQSPEAVRHLIAAYRVGLIAMDLLAKKIHDERMQAKYARTPSYGEDVKWLLGVAKKLGTSCLQEFCVCVVNSVASPFVLYDIITEIAQFLAKNQPGGSSHQVIRSPLLTPLIQKCQQMFIACIHAKLYHISPAEYDDFLSIIRSARQAFQLSPAGLVQFSDHLQTLRRSKSCKKDLWARIVAAQQQMSQQSL